MSLATRLTAVLFVLATGCAARPRAAANLAPREDSLVATSGIACRTEGDCAVCYRAGTCGEPIAASDPSVETPACHVSPAAFCMARRARCEEGRCTAR